ncbi:hypothetical protein E4U58_006873 [Claviceps cyperi]|nr:hypothetical protein E4U58_006873 [Claviceps cyperi]
MGCASNRKKQTRDFADQKWDYINLQDFKAKGCGPGFAYGYLWFMLITSIAVYAVDSFTAVNLLAFNRWSSAIQPAIPFDISKWIFSVCILLSFVNLAFEGIRAIRVMRRNNVAECFLDSLAVRWESIRLGRGQGWRRFLVFAELTKSKKGSEYVALFTYFSFQSWIRVIFCSGPLQVVNALTLRSVYQVKLAPTATSIDGAILGFFGKIKALASEDYRQAVILSGMCYTFVVWAFSALFLLMAVLFYVFFLFHWIPQADGGLAGYCERKVNKKLLRIVTTKVNIALAKGQANREKAEMELAKKYGDKVSCLNRVATLPTLPDLQGRIKHDLPHMPTAVGRDEKTTSILPAYKSRPSSLGPLESGSVGVMYPIQRTTTAGSTVSKSSISSRVPLVSCAAGMGYGQQSQSLAPSLSHVSFGSGMTPPIRSGTCTSQPTPPVPNARPGFGHASNSSMGTPFRSFTSSPASVGADKLQYSGHPRLLTKRSVDSTATAPPIMGRANTGPLPYQPLDTYDASGVPLPSRSITSPPGSMPPQREVTPMMRPPQRTMTAPLPTDIGYDGPRSVPNHGQGQTPAYRGVPYGHDVRSQHHSSRYY